MSDCPCKNPGPCPDLRGLDLQGRLFDICQGTAKGITPEQREAYLELWRTGKRANQIKAPGILQKGVNFSRAIVNHARTGFRTLTPEQHEARTAVCRGCEQFSAGSCLKCGCSILIKAKWEEQRCPLDKWPAIE